MSKLQGPTLTSRQFLIALSLFFTCALNFPFFAKVYGYLWSLPQQHWLFWLAIPVAVFALFYFLLSLFLLPKIDRGLMALLVLGSAVVSYTEYSFGVIFDHTMIDNFAETNVAEAKTYFNPSAVFYVSLLGILPALLLLKIRISYASLGGEVVSRGVGMLVALAVFAAIAGSFYKDFASTGRNNQHVHQYLVPNQLIYSVSKFAALKLKGPSTPFKDLTEEVKHAHQFKTPELLVLVLGETARAQNFSWDGYQRDTNHYTRERDFVNVGAVESCGTATAVSVPCMFSFLTKKQYSNADSKNQSNLLDVVSAAGFDVIWIDNNNGCKGVCNRVPHRQIPTNESNPKCDGNYCYDSVLIDALAQQLTTPIERDTLIVLHMIGSHGPTYFRRYPPEFRHFVPDCPRSDIQNCSEEEIINTYDNTVLYSDYVLAKSSELIERARPDSPSMVLYISDHGESLGEHGLFLHGMPYGLAPVEQKTVPELIWFSKVLYSEWQLDSECLRRLPEQNQHSQDNLSHTVLGLLNIAAPIYDAQLDDISPCRHS